MVRQRARRPGAVDVGAVGTVRAVTPRPGWRYPVGPVPSHAWGRRQGGDVGASPRISIGVAGPRCIEERVTSLLEQHFEDPEVVVADDASRNVVGAGAVLVRPGRREAGA